MKTEKLTKDNLELLLETIPDMNAEEIIRYSARFGSHPDRRIEVAFVKRVRALEREAKKEGLRDRALREAVRIFLGT